MGRIVKINLIEVNYHCVMLRKLIQKYGAVPLTIVFTVFSVLLSVSITVLINFLFHHEFVGFTGLFIAFLVPALLTPTFASVQLSLMAQLYAAEEKLRILAITDELTQVYNRRHFIELAEQTLAQAKKQGGTFSIIILDMDNFKQINDTYGHGIGDEILRHFCEACRGFLPETALLARYGGDEFVFLLRETPVAEANQFTQAIRKILSETHLSFGEVTISLQASFGAATYPPPIADLDTLLAQADQAMYAEKRKKGTQVR